MNRITGCHLEGHTLRLTLHRSNSFHAPLAALGVELCLREVTVEVEESTGDLIVTHRRNPDELRRLDAALLTTRVREGRFLKSWQHSDPSKGEVVVALDLVEGNSSSTIERLETHLKEQLPEVTRTWRMGSMVCFELPAGVMTPAFARRLQDALSFMF